MVRTDHEDGGALTGPDGQQDGRPTPSVERSSPLSRRRKSAKPEPEATTQETPDTTEQAVDDRTRGVSYRERRPSVKAPIGSGARSSNTVLVAVSMGLGTLVLVAAIVLSIVFTVAAGRIDDDRELRASYDQFAQEVVVKLTTLNKDNADEMLDFMNKHTSGRALQQMRDSMKQATDLIRKDDMKTKTTVAASAVEKADADSASVLVVFVWESTAPEAPDKPVVESFRSRIDITRINDDLKLTNFEWVG